MNTDDAIDACARLLAASRRTAVMTGAGARTVEINPRPTPESGSADLALRGPSGLLLPRVLEHLNAGPP